MSSAGYRRFTTAYQQTAVETASPGRTLVLLLEGARSRMLKGAQLLREGQRREATQHLVRAMDIILELERTLRPDKAGAEHAETAAETCAALGDTYKFILLHLTRANASGDAGLVDEAERVLVPIVEAFQTAVEQVARAGTTGQG